MHRTLSIALLAPLVLSTSLRADSKLTKAAVRGDLAAIQERLKAGEDINGIDSGGWTALMWAVYNRQTEVVQLLLEKGADPNPQSIESKKSYPVGTTALMIAANDCQEEVAGALVRKGARKEVADNRGDTAEACARRIECSGVLHALGFKAAANAFLDAMLKDIEGGKDVNAPDGNGWTPLMWSVYYQDLPTTALLLGRGAKPDLRTTARVKDIGPGATALMIAARGGTPDQAEALLKAKADPVAVDASGKTAGEYARVNRYPAVLEVLGESIDPVLQGLLRAIQDGKRPVNDVDEAGWSPLMLAAYHQELRVAKALLDLGADPNLQSTAPSHRELDRDPVPKGTSALILATRQKHLDLARVLIQAKARVGLEDVSGRSAVAYAVEQEYWDLQDLLMDRSPLKNAYTKLVVAGFDAGPKVPIERKERIAQCQQGALEALGEGGVFDKVELVQGTKAEVGAEAGALLVKVQMTKLKIPDMRSPKVDFMIQLIDGATGRVERKEWMSLTTDFWCDDTSQRVNKLMTAVGSVIADYVFLATGRALPLAGGYATEGSGLRLVSPRPKSWQWIEQLPDNPKYCEEGFTLASLARQRVAIWSISSVVLEPHLHRTMLSEYGSQDAFVKSLSAKATSKWFSLVSPESLGAEAIGALLDPSETRHWLNSRKILPWADSRILSNNQIASGFEALARHKGLSGIRYLILPHRLEVADLVVKNNGFQVNGSMSTVSNLHASLGVAILDLAGARVVWHGAFKASITADWVKGGAMGGIEAALLARIEQGLRGEKSFDALPATGH